MQSWHQLFFSDSRRMEAVPEKSVDLVVTSPPYPMIEMWDPVFKRQDPGFSWALEKNQGRASFERMHRQLDGVWQEIFRVLKEGGVACINVGDATRTVDKGFALYPNHARILSSLQAIGFTALPCILWRKQTNAPNKFMGSGMLPPGAYVTLEHEYILIVRKKGIRRFETLESRRRRRESAFFWEERNAWFSDVWMDLKGASQGLFDEKARKRSGAFPFELPYRLIAMFSIKGDTVLDPFLGTGTTLIAAAGSGRNSIGYELDGHFRQTILAKTAEAQALGNRRILQRLHHHVQFVQDRLQAGKPIKHLNAHYGFPVMTRQETELVFNEVVSVTASGKDRLDVQYADRPSWDKKDWERLKADETLGEKPALPPSRADLRRTPRQRTLF